MYRVCTYPKLSIFTSQSHYIYSYKMNVIEMHNNTRNNVEINCWLNLQNMRCIYCINKFSNTTAFIDQLFFLKISFHCQSDRYSNCQYPYSHWDPQNGACKSNSKENNCYPVCYKSTTICLFFKFLRNFIIFCSAIIVLGSLYAWENRSS